MDYFDKYWYFVSSIDLFEKWLICDFRFLKIST